VQISCIVADSFNDPTIEPSDLKKIGAIWGSWRTWRAWNTDNVVCNDTAKAKDLIRRAFQAVCNLYVSKKSYADLERPKNVGLFDGEFPTEFDSSEEIISMHLIAEQNDIVLLFGFDLSDPAIEDKFEKHKRKNYLAAFTAAVKMYNNTQWVVIDHPNDLTDNLLDLENITCDSYENVLELLS
jgi:hypothetical protein